jgi:hypothetical protein
MPISRDSVRRPPLSDQFKKTVDKALQDDVIRSDETAQLRAQSRAELQSASPQDRNAVATALRDTFEKISGKGFGELDRTNLLLLRNEFHAQTDQGIQEQRSAITRQDELTASYMCLHLGLSADRLRPSAEPPSDETGVWRAPTGGALFRVETTDDRPGGAATYLVDPNHNEFYMLVEGTDDEPDQLFGPGPLPATSRFRGPVYNDDQVEKLENAAKPYWDQQR